jgi:hypothetical protein
MSLLPGHGVRQLYRIEGLHPPRHPVTVLVLRARQTIRPVCVSLMSQLRNQLIWSNDIFLAFCCMRVIRYVATEHADDFGMRWGELSPALCDAVSVWRAVFDLKSVSLKVCCFLCYLLKSVADWLLFLALPTLYILSFYLIENILWPDWFPYANLQIRVEISTAFSYNI